MGSDSGEYRHDADDDICVAIVGHYLSAPVRCMTPRSTHDLLLNKHEFVSGKRQTGGGHGD